jgi:protein-tyrosine phosphatase
VNVNLLFVCRGNTCRSVLAHYIAEVLVRSHPVKQKPLIRSAGVEAWPGMTASSHTLQVLAKDYDYDASSHRASKLTPEHIKWADVIYTMTTARRDQITTQFPQAVTKLKLLSAKIPIEDPIGGDETVYRELAKDIEQALKVRYLELGIF